MPKSRKFRKNSIDFKYGFEPDPLEKALIKAKRDLPYTELAKVLPKPKTMLYYYQKNYGKHREPSIVIFNQKIQGRSKKMGGMTRSCLGKQKKTMKRRVKKTRRNRSNKYKKGMMGGDDTDPSTPPRRFNMIQLPPPRTPQGETIVIKEQIISPKEKGTTDLDNSDSLQPTILFPMNN